MAATQPLPTFQVAIGALGWSMRAIRMDQTNEAWLFLVLGAHSNWISMAGGQGINKIHYAYCMPCPPLEAQKGLKSPGHSREGRSQVLFHSGCPSWRKITVCKTFFSSMLQVQEARLISPHKTHSKTVTKNSSGGAP
ncbi:uncharacterized protein FMAN_12738 [Fusarium mangiferae]|uniref:Uncharacterized protein n=1 Tax=Fusarium mangiferae TaxID=192010 RepID=A0A1L7UA68_FUSMA|nr:uncharacterized protein FMAN_12738 [Fusarium mangiferae]CVL04627.1 uncharacterized protein FMAN_12738 [Fusarium mangiferae]